MSRTPRSAYETRELWLDNGLNLTAIRTPHLHHATVAVFVRVGSRHERPEDNGLSHLVEHMFFRGCEGFEDAAAMNTAMEDLGGVLDGYTTRDSTVYLSTVHPAHLEEALEIFGAMLHRPRFQELDVERSIILQELLDSLDDRGRDLDVDNLAHRLSFGEHPLAQSIDGPRKNLRRFTQEDLRRHRQRFYGAKNMVLAVAGPFDFSRLERAVKRAFGRQFQGRAIRDGAPPAPQTGLQMRYLRADDAQSRARLCFRTVQESHPDYLALSLLRRVLDGGLSAPLQVELVEKRGIVYEVGADLEAYSDTGLLGVELAVGHKKLAYALRELGRVLGRLRDSPVAQEELQRLQHRAEINLDFGRDSTSDLVHWFGPPRMFGQRQQPEQRLAQLARLTPEDVQRVAQQYLRPERLSVAMVGGASDKMIAEAKRAIAQLSARLGG